jgi:hypothetical protein
MRSMNKKKDIDRPSRIIGHINKIIEIFSNMQTMHLEKAREYGYLKDLYKTVNDDFPNDQDLPVLKNIEETLRIQAEIAAGEEKDTKSFMDNTSMIASVYTTASTTVSAVATFYPDYKLKFLTQPTFWTDERHKKYVGKLSALNEELGKTYLSVWESFYATTTIPEKQSLYAMRQTFDQFFRIIAPDNEVRNSQFFKEKSDEKERNKVHRNERMKYAANKYAKSGRIIDLLMSKTTLTMKTYKELNKIHSEKELEREKVGETLKNMRAILEEWIDVIGL